MKKQIVSLAFIITTIYACKHEVINVATVPPTGNTNPVTDTLTNSTTGVCFDGGVLPVFKSNCAKSGCHDAASSQDGYVLDSYANIVKNGIKAGNANDSKIYKMIVETDQNKRMPQPPNAPLTQAQINLIKTWINEGAKNTTNCSNTCDTTKFTYAAAIKPIIDANCLGCHSGPSAGFGLDYTTYAGLKAATANGRLLGALNHVAPYSPMPKGSAKLSDCKITQIRKWIQAGTPNN